MPRIIDHMKAMGEWGEFFPPHLSPFGYNETLAQYWAIQCEVSGKPFKIIAQELQFYRRHHLPIPRRCPEQRSLDRMSQRNPHRLFDRNCAKCNVAIRTTYSPDRPEIVYCEACYLNEIY